MLTWQISITQDTENISILEKSYVSENENGMVKIYWAVNGMKQDDPMLIEFIKSKVLVKPSQHDSSSNKNNQSYESSMGGQGQPYLVEKILGLDKNKNGKKGFFIEAGAADGETISNTLLFEIKYRWSGLLVEPNPDLLRQLYSKNRKAYILPHCLSTKPEVEIVTFDVSGFVSGIINEGKLSPSRVGDPNPNRPKEKFERKIQVN